MAELYRLDFPSGKSYIGITRHTAAHRFKGHIRAAIKYGKGIVYHAWKKHGSPVLVVLAIIKEEDMYEAERRAIAVFGTRYPAGYNMTSGGDVPPSLSPEVAEKISAQLCGRKLSEEHRLACSLGLLGFVHSQEARMNMSRAQKGKVFSPTHRAKLAAAKLGTKRPNSIRAKMSASQQARRKREGCNPQRSRYPGMSA